MSGDKGWRETCPTCGGRGSVTGDGSGWIDQEHAKEYPGHAKLRAMSDRRDAVSEFYDFLLAEKCAVLCLPHEHTKECRDMDGFTHCGFRSGELREVAWRPADLIGEFLGIDPVRLEEEKRTMVARMAQDTGGVK